VRVAPCLFQNGGRRSSSARAYKFSLLCSVFASVLGTTSGKSEVDMSTPVYSVGTPRNTCRASRAVVRSQLFGRIGWAWSINGQRCFTLLRGKRERKMDLYSAYRQYNSTIKRSDVDHTELPANTPHLPFLRTSIR